MKTNTKTDLELQQDVQDAIKWEPFMRATKIGVTTKDGVVTLSGTVDSYAKKLHAERATKNVRGVRALAENIVVEHGNSIQEDSTEIAKRILEAWKYSWNVPETSIKVKVEDGWVKLEGEVHWKYQEEAAVNTIKDLSGVKGVTNLIIIKSELKDAVEKKEVINSLRRNWSIDSRDVKVEVKRDKVKLTGMVHSLYQKEEAGRLAWNTPGVRLVENDLSVVYQLSLIQTIHS